MRNSPHLQYQRQEILSASPEALVTKLYDYAIQACHRKDDERVVEVLSTLIKGLNYDYELSGSLFELYKYCQKQARVGKFDEVYNLLKDIRDAWKEHVEPQGSQKKPKSPKGGYVV